MEYYMNSSLNMSADLCGIKTNLVAANVDNSLMFASELEVTKESLESLLQLFGDKTREKAGPFVKYLNDFSLCGRFLYHDNRTVITIDSELLHFLAYDGVQGKLVAFSITPSELLNGGAELSNVVKGLVSVFGVDKFCFLYRNTNITDSEVYNRYKFLPKVPNIVEGDVLLSATFSFDEIGSSGFVNAMKSIFGIGSMDVMVGIGRSQVNCILLIPDLENNLLHCQNIAIYSQFGNAEVRFKMSGAIGLTCMPGLMFYLNSEFNLKSVSLSASSMPGSVFQIPGTKLSICNCGLEIGYNGVDISLAAMAQINIRNLMWYGALGLSVDVAGIPKLDMISMAMNEVSISSLVSNLVGIESDEIEDLDILAIKPFDVKYTGEIDFSVLTNEEIIKEINKIVPNNYKLNAETTSVTRLPGNSACDVLDTKTMFHYWIGMDKKPSFPPQAYYASKHITLGAYNFEQGVFFAGKMVFFNKDIKIMFSAVKDKGLLAYAQMDAIENAIIKISGSQSSHSRINPVLGNSENSTLELLVTNYHTDKQIANPVVLYMDLSRNTCSLYVDGHVELCKIFSFDALLYLSKKRINLAVETMYFNMIKSSLYLDVEYQSFSKMFFAFQVSLDCTGLQDNLKKLSQLLNDAVQKYDEKINQAQKKIDDAEKKVSSLNREINYYRLKIEESKSVIKRTKWYRIAKLAGEWAKIGAYEFAIVGIYAAMKAAEAALEIARATLKVANKLGSGFLNAINAVVQGVLNVFFISHALLEFIVNGKQVSVKTDLELTILGKQISVNSAISLDKLINKPIEALEELAIDSIKDLLNDLRGGVLPEYENLEEVTYPYITMPEEPEQLAEFVAYGAKRMNQSKGMLEEIQNLYIENMREAEPEFSYTETDFKENLEMISYALKNATENMDSSGMDDLMIEINNAKENNLLSDEEYQDIHRSVQKYIEEVRPTSTTIIESCHRVDECVKGVEVGRCAKKVSQMRMNNEDVNGTVILDERDFDKFYGDIQTIVEKYFPRGSGNGYFNITDEDFFYDALNEARRESGCAYVEAVDDNEQNLFSESVLIMQSTPGYVQRLK